MARLLQSGTAALLIGMAVGVGVWIFKRAIDLATYLTHGWFAETWMDVGVPWVAVLPAAGGLLVGVVLHLARIPEEPGHGVAEVIETVGLGDTEFPAHHVPLKAGLAAVSLGSGAALGPEDPAVEIGGGLGSWLSARFGLDAEQQKALVAAGAAAGLGAAFHAPLAGVFLAVEVFTVRLGSRTTLLVAVAAGAGFGVAVLLDPATEPVVPAHGFGSGWEVLAALVLGVLAGVVAAVQIKLMYRSEHMVVGWEAPPRWAKPALGGVVLGGAGLVAPELLGIGYETLEPIIAGALPAVWVLLALGVGKMLLLAVSFGSGFLGGFFAPCLFIGAAFGAAFGLGAAELAGGVRPEVLALAGMAAMLAGCVRAPLTAVLLLAALSGDYTLTPVLLAAALPARRMAHALEQHSLYTYGIEVPAGGGPAPRSVDPATDADGGTGAAES